VSIRLLQAVPMVVENAYNLGSGIQSSKVHSETKPTHGAGYRVRYQLIS
jgi:hypothetical protein